MVCAVEGNEIKIGCDATFLLTVIDENDVAIPLTGERVRFALKRTPSATDPILVMKDSDNGPGEVEILASPNDNQARIKVLSADTVSLEEGTYCRAVRIDFVSVSDCKIPINDELTLVRSVLSDPIP